MGVWWKPRAGPLASKSSVLGEAWTLRKRAGIPHPHLSTSPMDDRQDTNGRPDCFLLAALGPATEECKREMTGRLLGDRAGVVHAVHAQHTHTQENAHAFTHPHMTHMYVHTLTNHIYKTHM